MDPLLTVGLLIIAGYLLLLMELAIIPGFGISGIAGLICLGAGSWVAERAFGALTGGLVVSAVIVLTTVLLVGFPRTRFGRQVVLRGSLAGAQAHRADLTPGLVGVAESDLRPAGIARFGERRASVVTEGEYLARGTRVRVSLVEGSRIVVEQLEDDAPTGEEANAETERAAPPPGTA